MSSLAGSFPSAEPGLPRGRGRLGADEVQAAQRSRILRAAISAIAARGIRQVTIADIVGRARVSRAAFYAQFATKEDCFIAAVAHGRDALLERVAHGIAESRSDDLAGAVRATVDTYLGVSASEPEFTYAWTVELPLAGSAAVELRNAYLDQVAGLLEDAHRRFSPPAEHRDGDHYLAVIAGCHELFYREVVAGRTRELTALGPRLIRLILQLLGSC